MIVAADAEPAASTPIVPTKHTIAHVFTLLPISGLLPEREFRLRRVTSHAVLAELIAEVKVPAGDWKAR